MHMDAKIGKQLSALGKTLTSLTGEDDEMVDDDEDVRLDSILSDDFEVCWFLCRSCLPLGRR